MTHSDELKIALSNYKLNYSMRKILTSVLIDGGLMTRLDLNGLFDDRTNIERCSPSVLALVYKTIYAHEQSGVLPRPEYFFGQQELEDSNILTASESLEEYPIVFHDVVKISMKDEYGFCLTYKQIRELTQSKVLRIRSDMQRESEIVAYDSEHIPCVKFSESKCREIADNILSGVQHPNTLRFHLIPDADCTIQDLFEYDENKKTLIIKQGLLANIDGNHRVNAIDYALAENPSIGNQYKMIIILTIGTPSLAKEIIVQEEQRTPINEEHVMSLKQTIGNDIVERLKLNDELRRSFNFCTTKEQFENGGGYFVDYMMADAIVKYFNIRKTLRVSVRDQIVNYLTDFLLEYYGIAEELYPNYIRDYYKHTKLVMSNPYTVYGLICFASSVMDSSDWGIRLESKLKSLDFKRKIGLKYVNYERMTVDFMMKEP